ncbi:MAG TPA: hypothetical protein VE825_09845 [Terriglobales bacterium]|jgi:hypothetical protein|nr:hypothetical protein [Terriglobales bacterium]
MLSKCANPSCSTPFRYLREGRLYRIDVAASAETRPHGPFLVNGHKGPEKIEHFWLCAECATSLTLAFEKDKGVTVVPRQPMQAA